jgi:hypothetical protein
MFPAVLPSPLLLFSEEDSGKPGGVHAIRRFETSRKLPKNPTFVGRWFPSREVGGIIGVEDAQPRPQ